eukprot:CAMPEP_0119313294 /NCGR_PEP_ID=MMETSP1333-20130426/28625_1 /TAXON_ID=418940 /ORGANISM="Scyphosphaera apsteinii, Strain RCC1455" /LENGTH=724 /DNA_ID=CAMNT_0007318099 /DNA_START=30 /DNA_END=2204 /DNA_ORIENTATION=+
MSAVAELSKDAMVLEEFRRTITGTDYSSVVDLVPDIPDRAMWTDQPNNEKKASCTFAKLKAFIAELDLRRFGVCRTDTVCSAIPNGPEAAMCFWAVSNQCVFAPLNPNLTVPEVEFELTDLPAHTMIVMELTESEILYRPTKLVQKCCTDNKVPVVTMVRDVHMMGLFKLKGQEAGSPATVKATTSEDVALVLHTSGTTKKPKIVPLTHDNITHGIQFVAKTLQRSKDDICLNVMPLFHIHGLIANVGASALSRGLVICSAFMGGRHFISLLSENPEVTPTWYSAVPTMHEAILQEAEVQGSALKHSLKLLRNCSAALLPPVSKRFLKTFGSDLGQPFCVVPTYAMTESFPICSNPPKMEIKLATVGPAMGPSVKILKGYPEDEEVPQGEEGEVCVTGKCVTLGYYMRPHMDADPNIEAFSRSDSGVGKMLRTGDKGYIDEDGYVQLVGRFKEIINCGGEKISPLEMEEQLLNVPGVETCVCFATPAVMYGEVVGTAVVPKAGCEPPKIEDLRDGITGFSRQWLPRVMVVMEAIPKGPTGKPKRIGLAKMLKIPTVGESGTESYKVSGKGDDLGKLQFLDGSPILIPPLTITLEMNPDLDDVHRSVHVMTLDEEGKAKLMVTTFPTGQPVEVEFPIKEESHPQEMIEYINRRAKEWGYGFHWESPFIPESELENNKIKNHDFCGGLEVKVPDEEKSVFRHFWPANCCEIPPGKALRLMGALELA